jgi:RNA polymerase sigma-70 factor (ECF subfamily)
VALGPLPARQRAVLVLCEALRWPAADAALLLGTTPASVSSALQRARATLATTTGRRRATDPALVTRHVEALAGADLDTLLTLLR